MKITVLLSCAALILSCGGNSENAEVQEDLDPVAQPDTIAESIPEEETVSRSFSTVEDYSQITSKEDLIDEFGEENLVHGESWYAEGTVRFDHSLLTNPENGHVVKYLWNEDGTLSSLEVSYTIYDEYYEVLGTQVIHSETGIHTGMALQDLKEWNGEDFDFFGFGWDFGGAIIADEGTRIAESPFQIDLAMHQEMDSEEQLELMGDQELNTSDEIVQDVPIVVERLTFYPSEK